MLYMNEYTLKVIHEDRVRDAEKHRAQSELIRDANEQTPDEVQSGLIQHLKQLVRVENRQPQKDSNDVRPAHAL